MFVRLSALNRLLLPLNEASRNGVDLTVSLPVSQTSRLHWLSTLLNQWLGRFHTTIVSIAETAVKLSQIAPILSRMATDLTQRARTQQQSAEAIAAASQDLAVTVTSIAQSAAEAAAFTSQVQAAAHEANESGARTQEQIRAIGGETEALATQFAALRESCETIGHTVHLIKGIADRTRILSLNATIEAARAGESGKGFVVVAEEIRKLADQTTEATRHVDDVLAGISRKVNEANAAMQAVQGQVADGVRMTGQARITLHDAAANIDTLIDHVRHIAQASQAQTSRVSDIASRISQVAQSTQHQLADAQQLATHAGQVRGETEQLLTEVGEFRFEGHGKTRREVERAVADWGLQTLERTDLQNKMAQLGRQFPAFELIYITDANGVQITGNVSANDVDVSTVGKSWRERPWFQDAVKRRGTYVSDLYRSVATDDFCFTVSTPLFDAAGRVLGVLGADVRFDHMLRL